MVGRYYYQEEVRHDGLNKYRVLKAETEYELNQKVASLKAQWNEQWDRKCIIRNNEESQNYANELTRDAEKIQEELDSILLNSLVPIPFDMNEKKDFSEYQVEPPLPPNPLLLPIEPKRNFVKYNPTPSFFDIISKKRAKETRSKFDNIFSRDYLNWVDTKEKLELHFQKEIKAYNEELEVWKVNRDFYKEKQLDKNLQIDKFIKEYKDGNGKAIEKYYSSIIEEIKMPFEYDRQVDAEYTKENKMLIIDILLPNTNDIPNLKKVTYIKSKGEYKESLHTEAYMNKKYDSVMYQIVLQTLNYIFKLDEAYDFIDVVVLNGKINTIDKATGKNIEPYVLSLTISKKDFKELNLVAIDPKAWFKSEKGISAATLAKVTPIAPVILMSREDNRFIEGYEVTNQIDDSVNLAAIDWQDFENLIREIFEKEFNSNGGEVKITQASRDGGVDAVAFDPDPIRGGKIVIQAKRYTNVVGVSAVRDLYGTLMNEGASKGILVTTSNYGNDAYKFAKGKPITLMNGANLLFLLKKHGHQARIDLKEAKEILKNEKYSEQM